MILKEEYDGDELMWLGVPKVTDHAVIEKGVMGLVSKTVWDTEETHCLFM